MMDQLNDLINLYPDLFQNAIVVLSGVFVLGVFLLINIILGKELYKKIVTFLSSKQGTLLKLEDMVDETDDELIIWLDEKQDLLTAAQLSELLPRIILGLSRGLSIVIQSNEGKTLGITTSKQVSVPPEMKIRERKS